MTFYPIQQVPTDVPLQAPPDGLLATMILGIVADEPVVPLHMVDDCGCFDVCGDDGCNVCRCQAT